MIPIQIEPAHFSIVLQILGQYASFTYVFGSRAKNTAKKFSDLDLVIQTELSKSALYKLQDQFEESNLPYKVDLVLWSDLDANFRQHIEKDLKPLIA